MKVEIKILFQVINFILIAFALSFTIILISLIGRMNIWPCHYGQYPPITDLLLSCPTVLGFTFKFHVLFLLIVIFCLTLFLLYKSSYSRTVLIFTRFSIVLGVIYAIVIGVIFYFNSWRGSCRAYRAALGIQCPSILNPFEWKNFTDKFEKDYGSISNQLQTPTPIPGYEELSGNLNFLVYEKLISENTTVYKNEQKNIAIKLSTVKEYGCLGYGINTKSRILENQIQIEILNIKTIPPGQICATAMGPAEFILDLGKLEGDYIFTLIHKNKKDVYQLSINAENISIYPVSASFTQLVKNRIIRFPLNTILASCWKSEGTLCNSFFSDLASLGAIELRQNEYLDYLRHKDELNEINIRLYEFQKDYNQLSFLIKKYSRSAKSMISITTWDGEQYFTWME